MSSKKKPSQTASNKKDKKSTGGVSNVSKMFYLIMLLLILTSSFVRISGSNRRKSASQTPTPTTAVAGTSPAVGTSETPALTLTYHYEDTVGKTCQDLTISSNGNAVYSNCLNGKETQYTLTSSEMTLLQGWADHFQAIQYDHPLLTKTGKLDTQLFLNGTGSTQADDNVDTRIENFAKDMIDKIVAQS